MKKISLVLTLVLILSFTLASVSFAASGSAYVSWNAVSGAYGYKVAINANVSPNPMYTANTYITITGLEAGKTYNVTIYPLGSDRRPLDPSTWIYKTVTAK